MKMENEKQRKRRQRVMMRRCNDDKWKRDNEQIEEAGMFYLLLYSLMICAKYASPVWRPSVRSSFESFFALIFNILRFLSWKITLYAQYWLIEKLFAFLGSEVVGKKPPLHFPSFFLMPYFVCASRIRSHSAAFFTFCVSLEGIPTLCTNPRKSTNLSSPIAKAAIDSNVF